MAIPQNMKATGRFATGRVISTMYMDIGMSAPPKKPLMKRMPIIASRSQASAQPTTEIMNNAMFQTT